MPFVMSMHWPEATLEQYDLARKEVNWEGQPAEGGLFHIAWMADDGFRVVDLWSSPEDFRRFSETRLNPAIQRIGIQGQPVVAFAQAHAIFNPFVPQAVRRAASRSSRRPASKRSTSKARPKKSAARPKRAAKTPAKRKGKGKR